MAASESDTQHAFIHAHAAVSANPLAIDPHLRLAALYQAVGDTAQARAQYLRATGIQPENPQPWVWLATFYAQTAHPRLARAAAERVLALDHIPPAPRGDLYTVPAAAIIAQATAELQAHAAQAQRRSAHRSRH